MKMLVAVFTVLYVDTLNVASEQHPIVSLRTTHTGYLSSPAVFSHVHCVIARMQSSAQSHEPTGAAFLSADILTGSSPSLASPTPRTNSCRRHREIILGLDMPHLVLKQQHRFILDLPIQRIRILAVQLLCESCSD